MFDILKKKLKKVVDSVSKKLEIKEAVEKPEVEEVVEEVEVKEIEKPVEVPIEQPKVEEVVEPEPAVEIPEEKIEPEPVKVEEKIEIPKVEKPKEPPEQKSIFKKVFERVVKKVTERVLTEKDIEPILEELETDLIEADVAVDVAEKIKIDLRDSLVGAEIKRGEEELFVTDSLKKSILEILSVQEIDLKELVKNKKPVTLLFLGFNGSGKTTSLAKCANWLMNEGFTCVFAAGDTFRAASIEQLEEHGKNLGVKVIKHKYGADTAAVVYDAIEHAKSKGIDFVLADSAGRAHTNQDLLDEMKKIIRVNKPDLKILVIDSLTGNDAIMQAKAFGDIGVDATIFTKVDVNEKGGAILSVTHLLKKPILFLGLGQEYDKLEKFDAEKFVSNVLSV
jgi:fused signal recognition particle receptor